MIRVYYHSDQQIRCSVYADDRRTLMARFVADYSDGLMSLQSQAFIKDWRPFLSELYRFHSRLQRFVYDCPPDPEFHSFDLIFD